MMNSQPECLNDRLEGVPSSSDPGIEALVEQARYLQAAPQLRVAAGFAWRLEQRVLARAAASRQRSAWQRRWHARWVGRPWERSLASVALLCVVLLLLGGTGALAFAQSARPDSPWYALKRWEQRIQYALDSPAVAQAKLDSQAARDQLNLLANFADPSHAASYQKALHDFRQSLATVTQEVQVLPAGQSKDQLQQAVTALRDEARPTLHGLLLHLALPERVLTSALLADLGESVPHLSAIVVQQMAPGKVQVMLEGKHLQLGAKLIIDAQVMSAEGVLRGGTYVFVLAWSNQQLPAHLGIMNPDGTVALSDQFVWKGTDSAHGGTNGNTQGNGNGNQNGGNQGGGSDHGNSNGGTGKPEGSPTPPVHH